MNNLYWLNEDQMARLRPYFPKSHGVPRVDDRRVLSGIILFNSKGLRWRDVPKKCGLHKTLYNRSYYTTVGWFRGPGHDLQTDSYR